MPTKSEKTETPTRQRSPEMQAAAELGRALKDVGRLVLRVAQEEQRLAEYKEALADARMRQRKATERINSLSKGPTDETP